MFLNEDPARVADPGSTLVAQQARRMPLPARRPEVRRLKGERLSLRKITARVGLSLQTVQSDLKA